MQLGRSQVSTLRPPPILSVEFNQDGRLFTVASETGYEVWRTWPLQLVRRRGEPDQSGSGYFLMRSAARDTGSSSDSPRIASHDPTRRWQGAFVPAK